MKKVVILTRSLLDTHSKQIAVGGVQTYIHDLAQLCVKLHYTTVVYQLVGNDINHDEVTIHGFSVRFFPDTKKTEIACNQYAFDKIYNTENCPECLFIIATDWLGIKSKKDNVVHIQHGIAFDNSTYYENKEKNFISRCKYRFDRLNNCIKAVKRCQHIKNTVCVDYNFFNWYRTLGTIYPDNFIRVIPNYSGQFISPEAAQQKLKNRGSKKRIIFARRFFDYRGCLLFAAVAQRLLNEFNNIEIDFAGDGPLKDYLTQTFKGEERVKIFSYVATESVDVHTSYDIAVVPTIFSEGTSLALCEAMAAACFPIATHVGGMTNIILDSYNGLLSYPDTESFYQTCRKALLMTDEDFNNICHHAYYSALCSFSRQKWENSWQQYIENLFDKL